MVLLVTKVSFLIILDGQQRVQRSILVTDMAASYRGLFVEHNIYSNILFITSFVLCIKLSMSENKTFFHCEVVQLCAHAKKKG